MTPEIKALDELKARARKQYREKFSEVVNDEPRIVKGIPPEIDSFIDSLLDQAYQKGVAQGKLDTFETLLCDENAGLGNARNDRTNAGQYSRLP